MSIVFVGRILHCHTSVHDLYILCQDPRVLREDSPCSSLPNPAKCAIFLSTDDSIPMIGVTGTCIPNVNAKMHPAGNPVGCSGTENQAPHLLCEDAALSRATECKVICKLANEVQSIAEQEFDACIERTSIVVEKSPLGMTEQNVQANCKKCSCSFLTVQ